MRADVYLCLHGIAKSRTAAAALIDSGVMVCGKRIKKPSEPIPDGISEEDIIICSPFRFVGRGGLKLDSALDYFNINVTGIEAVDLGASTGGFTDCLLQRGAACVYAIDVGHGQLDSSLVKDKRVINMEGVNAREITPHIIGGKKPLVVSDLSFISQTLVYPTVIDILTHEGYFVSLIKPQFEVGRTHIKNGIVHDGRLRREAVEKCFSVAVAYGLIPIDIAASPIEGGDGNREYTALFSPSGVYMPEKISKAIDKCL